MEEKAGFQQAQTHNLKTMSYQRRCDVMTSHRRWYDVVLTSYVCWVALLCFLLSCNCKCFVSLPQGTIFFCSVALRPKSTAIYGYGGTVSTPNHTVFPGKLVGQA